MEDIRTSGRVTSSAGDVDADGELVGSLVTRIGTTLDPGRYVEKPGLDERLMHSGADVASVRRMLGVAS